MSNDLAGIQVSVQRIYSKSQRFEVTEFFEEIADGWDPQISLQANPRYTQLKSGRYEVVLSLQMTLHVKSKPVVQFYLEYAGLFVLNQVAPEQHDIVLYGFCPNILFPYLGVTINQPKLIS